MGKLISVTGGDRARVKVLAEQLASWLHERGVQVVQFSLPTRGPVGALIRLQAQSRLQLDPASLALLWTADRLDLLSREGGIVAQLQAGMTVLCTHYAWWENGHCAHSPRSGCYAKRGAAAEASTAMTLDPAWVERIHARCVRPDLSLCVDGEESLDHCRQEISAMLWPGEEPK